MRPLFLSLVAVCTLALGSSAHSARPADDDADLPETLRRSYVAPVDGPADDRTYARGALGLVRPGFGRASLYVAWRVMHVAPGALAREAHRREGSWLLGPDRPAPREDEIESWQKARAALVSQPPVAAPAYFRSSRLKVAGVGDIEVEKGQCGPDAYAFATRTLQGLVADASLKDAHRRTWIAGQDAVFSRCAWKPGQTPVPALPVLLEADAPARLKALNAYQRAAALFYGDEYVAARQAFDAIAAVPDHPMRPWATLGALRSVVREAVNDAEWDAAMDEAWTKRQLRGAAFDAAIAEPASRRRARVDAAFKEINARFTAARADASLAPVQASMGYTVRRALMQLSPALPLRAAMKALERSEDNPYTMGTLDLFQELYPRVAPDRPQGATAAALREHEWFDFVVTVQGCSDVPRPVDASVCDQEHAHALARWQQTKDNAWLLATLMTARRPSATDTLAAEAARAVRSDRPEWASLQLYGARVLRLQGRHADAGAMLEALARSSAVHQRDRELLEAERRAL